jgi:hypothetical protein
VTQCGAQRFSLSAPPLLLLDVRLDVGGGREVIISAASQSFVLGEFLGFYGRARIHTLAQPSSIPWRTTDSSLLLSVRVLLPADEFI